jgi:hypothetical protein
LTSRIAALGGAALLAVGGVALWLSADSGPAEASRTTASAPLPPATDDSAGAEGPTPLLAPPPPAPLDREGKRFARADRDDDGRITQAEFLATRRRNFDKLDVNGDGRLSFEEYAASGIARFAKADTNGDKVLNPSEFATTAQKRKAPKLAATTPCPTAEGPAGDPDS